MFKEDNLSHAYSDRVDYGVYHADKDVHARLHIHKLLSIIQEISIVNELRICQKKQITRPENSRWLLNGYSLRFDTVPKEETSLTIETWLISQQLIYVNRGYDFYDQNKNWIGSGLSRWFLVDKNTHAPIRDTKSLLEDDVASPSSLTFPCYKAKPTKDDLVTIGSFKVHYSDLDDNFHMNNTNYARRSIDALSDKIGRMPEICGLDINFLNEFKLGETAYIKTKEIEAKQCYHPNPDSNTIYIEGHKDDGVCAFIAQIHYR